MATFAIVSLLPTNAALANSINNTYPKTSRRVTPYLWFLKEDGVTTEDICAALKIQPGGVDSAIVIRVSSYFGMGPQNLWEWLAAKGKDS